MLAGYYLSCHWQCQRPGMGKQEGRNLDLPTACHPISGWPPSYKSEEPTVPCFIYIFSQLYTLFLQLAAACPSTLQAGVLNCILRSPGFPQRCPRATLGKRRGKSQVASVPGWTHLIQSEQTHFDLYLTLGFYIRYSLPKEFHCYFFFNMERRRRKNKRNLLTGHPGLLYLKRIIPWRDRFVLPGGEM